MHRSHNTRTSKLANMHTHKYLRNINTNILGTRLMNYGCFCQQKHFNIEVNMAWQDVTDSHWPTHSWEQQGCYSFRSIRILLSWHHTQYPGLRNAQNTMLYSLADLFNRTPSQLLLEVLVMLQLMCEDFVHKYPPQAITRYSNTQLSQLGVV